MNPGDVVRHIRTNERMTVESVEGRRVCVAWFDSLGYLHRKCFIETFLVAEGMALA